MRDHRRRSTARRTGLLALLVLAVAAAGAAPAAAKTQHFRSPSGNIQCSIGTNLPDRIAYCQSLKPSQSVYAGSKGVKRCIGTPMMNCIGDYPPSTRFTTLAYGSTIGNAEVECTSRTDGMNCVLTDSGHGFLIRRSGIKAF